MKRSSSAPSLLNCPSQGTLCCSSISSSFKTVRSSTCLHALPPVNNPVVEVRTYENNITWRHFQIQSMLKAPSHTIDSCMLDVYGKPIDLTYVVEGNDPHTQEFAYCLATPPECPECHEVSDSSPEFMVRSLARGEQETQDRRQRRKEV